LADLSEGYPHFVQQFGYSAFEHDSDNLIDLDDVGDSAFKPGGALSQLGDKFFNEMYHARISSEDYRRVLDAMADHGDDWVARKTIIKESGVSEANVDNALSTLKLKEIILQDDTRRGYYRLPTYSFAAWINALKQARAKSDATEAGAF
jgi:predicted Rossmann fold nucleotide-binding protein DprA/Smf involved in DNA uptake